MATAKKTTKELMLELEELVNWFEQEDIDLDAALGKFERGLEVSEELKKRINDLEVKVSKVQARFDQTES